MTATDTLLLTNLLIQQHGENAREYAKRKMWECRRNKDAQGQEKWQALIDALKQARDAAYS